MPKQSNIEAVFTFHEEPNPEKKATINQFYKLAWLLEQDYTAANALDIENPPAYFAQIHRLEQKTAQSIAHLFIRYAEIFDEVQVGFLIYLNDIGFNLKTIDAEGHNLLHIAAMRGFLKLSHWLIEHIEINIELCTFKNIHPLTYIFLFKHYPKTGIECIENNLIDYYIEALPYYSQDKNSALIMAAQTNQYWIIEWLLKYRLSTDPTHPNSIHYRNKLGISAIDVAIMNNHTRVVETLKKYGADHLSINQNGLGIFHFLAHYGKYELFLELYEANKSQVILKDLIDCEQQNLLHYAIFGNHFELVKYLAQDEFGIINPDMMNNGYRLVQVMPDNYKIIQWLHEHKGLKLQNYPQGEITDPDFISLLDTAIIQDNLAAMEWLLELEGFDIYQKNNSGRTALHFAAIAPGLNIIKRLLTHYQFDVHAQDDKGQTALHLAITDHNLAAAQYLVDEWHACLEHQDADGHNALFLAASNDPNAKNDALLNWLIYEKNQNYLACNKEGTPLTHILARAKHSKVLIKLLNLGKIDMYSKDNLNMTLLDIAIMDKNLFLTEHLVRYIKKFNLSHADQEKIRIKEFKCFPEYLKLLVTINHPGTNNSIVDINSFDLDGDAICHNLIKYSAPDYFLDFFSSEVKQKFNFDLKNAHGQTPLALLIEQHSDETIKTFINQFKVSILHLNAHDEDIYDLIIQQTSDRFELLKWLLQHAHPNHAFLQKKQIAILKNSFEHKHFNCFNTAIHFFQQQPHQFQHPLIIALTLKNLSMFKYLVETLEINPDIYDEDHIPLLQLSAKNKKTGMFDFLIHFYLHELNDIEPIQRALQDNHIKAKELIPRLFSHGEILLLQTLENLNMFEWRSSYKGQFLLSHALKKQHHSILSHLIVHHRCQLSDTPIIDSLLNPKISEIQSHLDLFMRYDHDNEEVQWLHQFLARYPKGWDSTTLAIHVVQHAPTSIAGAIFKHLDLSLCIDAQANNVLHIAAFHQRLDLIPLLIQYPTLLEQKNQFGRTPLHHAVAFGLKEVVSILLKLSDMALDIQDKREQNLLHQAIPWGMNPIIMKIIAQYPHLLYAKDIFGHRPIDCLKQDDFLEDKSHPDIQDMLHQLSENGLFNRNGSSKTSDYKKLMLG